MNRPDNTLERVAAALEADLKIDFRGHPLRIALDSGGVLTLEGELGNIAAKKLALERAAAVPGVSGIVDRLRVEPSRRMSDAEVLQHVRDALLQEPVFETCALRPIKRAAETALEPGPAPKCEIDVSVADGVVTLDGRVGSLAHKRLAGALAWWVPGSRDVVNGIEVTPPQEDSDDEIVEAVALVLQKDPLINGERIRVTARDAVVTLQGLVANQAESEMAEMDAWYVFGVDGVVNRLERAS
jgi:osmotically-inducible protein OsmY